MARLLFEANRCTGVEVEFGGELRKVSAREVIVSAGAIHSPALLMRSGVGPAAHLREYGIGVVADVPGVGQNLMEHPSIALASFIHKEARVNNLTRRHIMLGWRYASQM